MKLLKYKSFRQSLSRISSRAGRNRTGRITVRHQGGGHKRLYRVMSRKPGVNGLAVGFEYDPNRSARLVKLYNSAEGAAPFSYALAPRGLRVFGNVRALSQKPHGTSFEPGDSAPLRGFEAGDFVYDVEMTPGRGGLFARSAGSFCRVLQSSHSGYARLRLPSGEHRLFSLDCTAAFGVVSNEEHMNTVLGKAGRSR
jgi:large subunit ribosomal protein L2